MIAVVLASILSYCLGAWVSFLIDDCKPPSSYSRGYQQHLIAVSLVGIVLMGGLVVYAFQRLTQ